MTAVANAADEYKWNEEVEGLNVFSVSYDNYGTQHIVLQNSSDLSQPSSLFTFEKNQANQHFENPKNYTVIPYFSYGINVTEQYLNNSNNPQIQSFGHYVDESGKIDNVVDLNGQKTIINVTSTEETLVITDSINFGSLLAKQFIAASSHKLTNNLVYVQFGDLHFRFEYSKTPLGTFSDDQKTIITNIITNFVLIHAQFASVPGLILNNFDGDGTHAYLTFAKSEAVFQNVIVVDEATFAYVAQK